MDAFKGLYKKELLISRHLFFTGLGLLILAFIGGIGLGRLFEEPTVFSVVTFLTLSVHVLYIPGFLLSTLTIEGKSQLWLHNPNSGVTLFMAKLAAAITYFIISIVINIVISGIAISRVDFNDEYFFFKGSIFGQLSFMGWGVLLTSIYLGIWMIFYWTLFQTMKNIPIINKFRWWVIIIIWFGISSISQYIRNLPFYKNISELKVVDITTIWGTGPGGLFNQSIEISIITVLLYVLVAVGVFFSAVRLLERKVEV
ncbi:hypothetical protein SM124_03765 (plasmid) [Bacillus sp. 31A1R]|uniref:ABC-2 family transporter protein n=1 Tax=Robertmurraya mangrovi TaxID=3098077 RepID=A0ABU5IUN8_9BACI|nr:hypothetical protein [Bacillus sp. 31A1R]MDZ5470863.1 hypothetical protein [Bacillus sp. 31A1R]